MQVLFEIAYFGFAAFHVSITWLFFVAFMLLLFTRHAPYSGFYVAALFFVQSIYNGCPFSDIENWLAVRVGYAAVSNQFLFGVFEQYTLIARVICLILSLIILRYSYQAWLRPQVVVDFGRCFQRFG